MSKTVLNYQLNKWQTKVIETQKKYNILMCSRSLGKSWLMSLIVKMAALQATETNSIACYISPQLSQSKKIALELITADIADLCNINYQTGEILIKSNRCRIYMLGLTDADRVRGLHVNTAMVIDEFGDVPMNVWSQVIYPTCQRRNPVVYLAGTPKQGCTLSKMYEVGLQDPDTYSCHKIDIYEGGVYTEQQIAKIKSDYEIRGDLATFNQEYLLNPNSTLDRYYYRSYLEAAKLSNRITTGLLKPNYPVYTALDLGGDGSAIWFAQKINGKLNLVDFWEVTGCKLDVIIQTLLNKGYSYKAVYLPWDSQQQKISEDYNMASSFKNAGLPVKVLQRLKVDVGIHEVTTLIRHAHFDADNCKLGIEHLNSYSSQIDRKTGNLIGKPLHDIHSHASDAIRYMAIGIRSGLTDSNGGVSPVTLTTDFDVLN